VTAREPFAYALLRVVPDAGRGEAVNAGIILYCRGRDFLELRSEVPEAKLRTLDSNVDLDAVARHLRTLELIAAGDPAGGSMANTSASSRFNWIAAPTSTVVQPSDVHTGLCSDPAETLEKLFLQLVA
jgi:hypothetical protein